MEATHACKEVVWLERLCLDVGFKNHVVRLDCDSQSEMFLEKKPTYHIDVQCNFVRDMVENQKVLLVKVDTMKTIVDSLTKTMST